MIGIIISAVTFAISFIICLIVGGGFSDNKLLLVSVFLTFMVYSLYELFRKKDTNEDDSSFETGEKKLTFAEKIAEKKRQKKENRIQIARELAREMNERKEQENIRKAKEQAEIELKEKREKEEIEKRISYFENSEATKKIVEYIKTKSSGTPHTITIDTFNLAEQKTKKHTTITFYFEGGHGSYNFSEFNLKSLEMPEDTETFSKSASQEDVSKWFLNKWSKKNNAYYLAAAINRHFNNQFKIEELFYSYWGTPHNVVESDSTTRTYEMANINAKLTREMRSF